MIGKIEVDYLENIVDLYGQDEWVSMLTGGVWEFAMAKTITTRYDVAEHLGTPEEMAVYFEACLDEVNGDAAFIAKALGAIARAKGSRATIELTTGG